MADTELSRDLAEIRRRVADLVTMAERLARTGTPASRQSTAAQLRSELAPLVAAIKVTGPTPTGATQRPADPAPARPSRDTPGTAGPGPSATEYWFG